MAKNCQTYDEAVLKLENALDGTKALPEIRKLFTDFYRKFTMIPSLWIKLLELERTAFLIENDEARNVQQNIKDISKTHFFHPHFDESCAWKKEKIAEHLFFNMPRNEVGSLLHDLHYKPTHTAVLEKLLHFPHLRLNEIVKICDIYGTQPLSQSWTRKYHQSKELFESLWGNQETVEENWYQRIIKKEDKNFVKNSFEYYLGEENNYKKIHIWKAYIAFLENVDQKLMLAVYSRYCRLFVDDLEMKENYRKEVERMNRLQEDVSMWWIDLIEIERQFVSFSSARRLLEKVSAMNSFSKNQLFCEYKKWFRHSKGKPYFNYSLTNYDLEMEAPHARDDIQNDFYLKKQQPSKTSFSPINELRQHFSLPFHYMTYLRSTSNYEVLQKLYQSCKFFFIKSQTPLCYRLGIFKNAESTYFKQSLLLSQNDKDFNGLNGITLSNTLQVPIRNKHNIASIILSKISKCEIKHLQLLGQHLTEKEFNFISGDKIKTVFLQCIEVTNSDGDLLSIEKIFEKFPNADTALMRFFANEFSEDTAQKLAKLNRSKNLVMFSLGYAPATFDENFFDFVKKFVVPKARIFVEFDATVDKSYKKNSRKREEVYSTVTFVLLSDTVYSRSLISRYRSLPLLT